MTQQKENSNSINIHINDFDGPLELLIHLIKQSEMDITDIKIEDITNQYMNYLKSMKQLNFNIAGEYFVMAANLMEIKSKMLLSHDDMNDVEDDNYEDPREDLVNQLLIYQEYKEISKVLKNMKHKSQKHHSVHLSLPTQKSSIKNFNSENINVSLLQEAFKKIYKDINKRNYVHSIKKWNFTVKEQSDFLMNTLSQDDKVEFNSLFQEDNIELVVTTFLALLELVKRNAVTVSQIDDHIYLQKL